MAPISVADHLAIKHTLSRYCIAVDKKDFGQWPQIFTETLSALYPFGPEEVGFEDLRATLTEKTKPLKTNHALSTQLIEPAADCKSASATTYFTASHWDADGKGFTVFGRYHDTLVLVPGREPEFEGASGQWLISKRKVEAIGRSGI